MSEIVNQYLIFYRFSKLYILDSIRKLPGKKINHNTQC